VNGVYELRESVANHYNRLYRRDAATQYTAENVSITAGGRIALNRAVAALGDRGRPLDIGYTLPDYAAYNDILERNMPRLRPLPSADPTSVDALLMSNPCNPTGEVLCGEALRRLIGCSKEAGSPLIMDEFYSHYIYDRQPDGHFGPAAGPVSAAAYVEDTRTDPVFVIDGLTKNFRYPGWRLGWIVGPVEAIDLIGRIGQDLDGGPSRVVQKAALAALEPSAADQETTAVRTTFAHKRNVMVDGLRAAGVRVDVEPRGSFYVWGSLADMPGHLRDAHRFFKAALDARVIVVPGAAFDLHPGGTGTGSFDGHIRFSYGPAEPVVVEGLRRLREVTRGGSLARR
jgi:aspartate/methionine/tyrosine aminotransferase